MMGGFVYAVWSNPISAGYAKTGACVGGNRKLDARFCVKGFQELTGRNASAPTAQLLIIRAIVAVIAYRKWNFREMGVPRAFLRLVPLKRDAYAKLPDGQKWRHILEDDEAAVWGEYLL